jgi:2-isopropylmalate synthase
VRFKELADRKKEVYDDDLARWSTTPPPSGSPTTGIQVKFLRVICGTEAPQSADLILRSTARRSQDRQGDGPVDAVFNAVKALVPRGGAEALPGGAVTDGHRRAGDGQVRLEEDGKIVTGQAADTDTIVASARAYVNARASPHQHRTWASADNS